MFGEQACETVNHHVGQTGQRIGRVRCGYSYNTTSGRTSGPYAVEGILEHIAMLRRHSKLRGCQQVALGVGL